MKGYGFNLSTFGCIKCLLKMTDGGSLGGMIDKQNNLFSRTCIMVKVFLFLICIPNINAGFLLGKITCSDFTRPIRFS